MAPENANPDPLQILAHRLHFCGPRAIFEFLADIRRGRPFSETVADFSRLDPAHYVAVAALLMNGGGAHGR